MSFSPIEGTDSSIRLTYVRSFLFCPWPTQLHEMKQTTNDSHGLTHFGVSISRLLICWIVCQAARLPALVVVPRIMRTAVQALVNAETAYSVPTLLSSRSRPFPRTRESNRPENNSHCASVPPIHSIREVENQSVRIKLRNRLHGQMALLTSFGR